MSNLGNQELGDIILGASFEEEVSSYYAHGQAQAWVEATYNQHGQAQSQIKQTYYAHGQSQAQIKQTYYVVAQAEAIVANTYFVHGQANALILGSTYQFAQSQGQILQTYNTHGQAQAKLQSTSHVVGQAQASVMGIVLLDTFTRNVASVATFTDLGEPDIGPVYTDFEDFSGAVAVDDGVIQTTVTSGFNYQGFYIENSNLSLRGNFEIFADFYQENINDFAEYGEVGFVERTALPATNTGRSLRAYVFDGEFVLSGSLLSAIVETPFTPVAGTTYRIRLRLNGTTARAKIWDITSVEPDWMLTGTLLSNSVVSPTIYADIGEGPTAGTISIDNITVLAQTVEPPFVNITYIGSTASPLSSTIGGTVAWPAGHQAGDIGLLFVEVTGGGTLSLTTAAGFANVSPGPVQINTGTNGTKLAVYWCRATSSSQTDPVLDDGGDHIYATMLVFRGVRETGNPWDRSDAYNGKVAASTSLSILGLSNNPTRIPYTHVVIGASRDNDNAAAAFSNWVNNKLVGTLSVERHDAGTTQGNGGGLGIISGTLPDTTTIGTTTATVTSSINPAMIIALAPPRLIAGQARAFIQGGQTNQFGQAQADIFSLTKNAYGQANAYIYTTRNILGQSQAYIKIVDSVKHGQAEGFVTDGFKLRTGQAQALINVPIKYGQAQSRILTNYKQHGQSRAVVIIPRWRYAQAQALIGTLTNGYGQANAYITTTKASGQAQAQIVNTIVSGQARARILRTFNGLGQALAYIRDYYHLYFQDTFSRVISDDNDMPGVPDVGAYATVFQTWYDGFTIDGSVGQVHVNNNGIFAYADFNARDVTASIDFMFPQESTERELFLYTRYNPAGFPYAYIYIYSFSGVTQLFLEPVYGVDSNLILDYELLPDVWYTLKLETIATSMRGKFWERDEPEPDWMVETSITTLVSGGAAYQVDIFALPTAAHKVQLDNFMVYRDGEVNPVPFTLAHGQAQAYITQPINRMYGQAKTWIEKTTRIHGLARARIGFRTRHGQARAFIQKHRSNSGQAQGFLWNTSIAIGWARAYITKPQRSGQAQAQILGFGQTKSGNAQARILASVTRYGTGQANALIHQDMATGQAAALIDSPVYLARYNGFDLPGYVQSEVVDSIQEIIKDEVTYVDGSLSEYFGLRNKILSLRLKAVGNTYAEVKKDVQTATTIVRSNKTFTKLYVHYPDRYYLALTKRITTEKTVGESMRLLDYIVEFETKPWLLSDKFYTIEGTGTITTDDVGRTITNGGWSPVNVSLDGTNVTISGYTEDGQFAGYIAVSGSVTNLIINSEEYTATINGVNVNEVMFTPNYQLFVGPGKTTYVITGATRTEITYQDRWYL